MLKKLVIEQFVIIDRLDLDFQPGLTVLTGETGAGKSILLDALGLMLGDPASPSAIREGAEQSLVEAYFVPPPYSGVFEYIALQEMSEEEKVAKEKAAHETAEREAQERLAAYQEEEQYEDEEGEYEEEEYYEEEEGEYAGEEEYSEEEYAEEEYAEEGEYEEEYAEEEQPVEAQAEAVAPEASVEAAAEPEPEAAPAPEPEPVAPPKSLEERVAEHKGELHIRRITKTDGSEEISVNGKPYTPEKLKKIGSFLGEIHGQNANHTLLDPANQQYLLDLSGNYEPEILQNVANSLQDLRRYQQEREDETAFFTRNIQSQGKIESLVGNMEAIGLHEFTVEQIEAEYFRLLTAHETSEVFQEIVSHLVASNGAIKALTAANMAMKRSENLEAEKMVDLEAFLADALKNARAAVNETTRLAPEYEIDTKPLRIYKEKLIALQKISQENQVHIENMSQFYKDTHAKLERLRGSRDRISELAKLIEKSDLAYRKHAHILTERRIAAGKLLSEEINKNLPPLKLMGAEFKVDVQEKPNDPWTELGFNIVTFMVRMNPGQPFSKIAETASGGELARTVLALKVVLQAIQSIPTLVFDEVDTGIGGGAAAAVGERIAALAETTQTLVITHSPQVASRADQALHVSKKSDGITTTSVVRTLTLEERTNELSRMLAGDTITDHSRAAAKSLLDEAAAAAEARRQAKKEGQPGQRVPTPVQPPPQSAQA
jgi:DNA repair protein RecN (Recombination protein N)